MVLRLGRGTLLAKVDTDSQGLPSGYHGPPGRQMVVGYRERALSGSVSPFGFQSTPKNFAGIACLRPWSSL